MTPTTNLLSASDGKSLAYHQYLPNGAPRSVILGLHGIQSHAGWYHESSQRLAAAGHVVIFADRRGAGQNQLQRGHADSGMRLLHDVRQLYDFVSQDFPDCPVTLMGLSWGGKIAAAFAARKLRPLHRLVLLYPGLCPRIRPNAWQRCLLWFARTHDLRHKSVPIPLSDPTLFTDNVDAQQMIRTDPLALHHVTSGFINAGLELDRILRTSPGTLPKTFVALAGKDRIIDNAATKELLRQLTFESLHLTEYPDARHTLEFEPNRNQIFEELIEWLNA
ncbi:MAG: alpha/beta hydrolase [Fuerstiella sp.]